MPLIGTFALAFAGIIAIESIVFNLLSIYRGINATTVLWVHLAIICALIAFIVKTSSLNCLFNFNRFAYVIRRAFSAPENQLFLPLLFIIGLTAWLYPPNNYDSLTYHMARVAHWIQNGSIGYFTTPIDRQNVMGPGVEYLFLFSQVLSQTDKLATMVQFLAYILLIPSSYYICRIIKIPKPWAYFVVILTVTAPIAVFQASNTKNDLCAALIAYSIIIACRRIIVGRIENIRVIDYVFLGISTAVAFLVKPTALIVVMPIIALSLIYQLASFGSFRKCFPKILVGGMCAFLCFSVVAGPDVYRKIQSGTSRHEVYPLLSEYDEERLWNPVRVLAHNIPFQKDAKQLFDFIGVKGETRMRDVFNLHEDMVGNPYQVTGFLLLSFISVLLSVYFIWKRKYQHKVLLSLSPILSWMLFGLIVKDQPWITRLEIPLFYTLPFSFVLILSLLKSNRFFQTTTYISLLLCSILSLSYALFTAANVPARQLILHYFWGESPSRSSAYYNNANLKDEHDFFLGQLGKNNCKDVGLILGPDSVDYPLTWRAMQTGASVRHLRNQVQTSDHTKVMKIIDDFEGICMIYVASGNVEHVPEKGKRWLPAGDYHTFIRNISLEFNESDTTCLDIAPPYANGNIAELDEVEIVHSPNRFHVISAGNDPQLSISGIDTCPTKNAVMRIEMRSPSDTMLQMFYQTDKNRYFSEGNSIKKVIALGDNIVYLSLPLSEISGPLRLDIGKEPGDYEIISIQVRAY